MSTSRLERRGGAEVTATSWEPPDGMAFEEWCDAGRQLGVLGRASHWWIGDWINFGADRYPDRYEAAVEVTGYDIGSLMDMAWVASRFSISERSEVLSWSHHRAVASLPEEERGQWLERAAEKNWPRKRLSSALRNERERGAITDGSAGVASVGSSSHATPALTLRLSHSGEPESIAKALDKLCVRAEKLGFEVLERPDF